MNEQRLRKYIKNTFFNNFDERKATLTRNLDLLLTFPEEELISFANRLCVVSESRRDPLGWLRENFPEKIMFKVYLKQLITSMSEDGNIVWTDDHWPLTLSDYIKDSPSRADKIWTEYFPTENTTLKEVNLFLTYRADQEIVLAILENTPLKSVFCTLVKSDVCRELLESNPEYWELVLHKPRYMLDQVWEMAPLDSLEDCLQSQLHKRDVSERLLSVLREKMFWGEDTWVEILLSGKTGAKFFATYSPKEYLQKYAIGLALAGSDHESSKIGLKALGEDWLRTLKTTKT